MKLLPSEFELVLMGEKIRWIRKRKHESEPHTIDIMFESGHRYEVIPEKGAEILGCLINIVEKSQPITHVNRHWLEDGSFVVRFYADRYELFKLHVSKAEREGFPVYMLARSGD